MNKGAEMYTITTNYRPVLRTTNVYEVLFWLSLGYLAYAQSGRQIDELDLI